MIANMRTFAPADAAVAPPLRERQDIPDRFKWDLTHIFPDWQAWQAAYAELDSKIARYATLQGTIARGDEALLAAFRLSDEIGQLTYKVWYFAALRYDEDQRDNQQEQLIDIAQL